MASASQRSISTIRHAPVMLIAAPPGPGTSTRGDGARLLWREDYPVCLRNRPRGRLHRDAWVVDRSAGVQDCADPVGCVNCDTACELRVCMPLGYCPPALPYSRFGGYFGELSP